MALPMDDPYRGYAPVTHDTNRVAETITELNALGTRVTTAESDIDDVASDLSTLSDGLPNTYALSPSHTFFDATIGDGTTNVQTISSGSFSSNVLDFDSANIDTASGWNASSNTYTIPANGTYYCTLRMRILGSYTSGGGIGFGVHNSLVDFAAFQWYAIPTIDRKSFWYERIAIFAASDSVWAYAYQDSDGGGIPICRGHFQIWRMH
jgi:hypothetical protein